MAKIVLGIGTSHSPMLAISSEFWPAYAQGDSRNRELLTVKGETLTYDEHVKQAAGRWDSEQAPEHFKKQHENMQAAIASLKQSVATVKPDVMVIFGDDQDEVFFDDNYPAFAIYGGETVLQLARPVPDDAPEWRKAIGTGYGHDTRQMPCDPKLARYLTESLTDNGFDIAFWTKYKEQYGGTIGPSGYVNWVRTTKERPQGYGHAYGFVSERLMGDNKIPMVQINLNTCYPPNQPSPRRSFELGQAVRDALVAYDSDLKVAVAGSGGLSHFMVDEDLDRQVLTGFVEHDAEALCNIPYERMNSATSEGRNWIACAGAAWDLKAEVLNYEPVRRTPAGSGGGWAFVRWQA